MAEVFAGSTLGAEGFSRRVAIKRVLPGYSDSAGFARMFVAEAQISAQLVHPNIVSVLDFDRDAQGRLFLVMELVDGVDLAAVIASGLLPFPVVIFAIAEILRGLGFAHDLPTGTDLRGVIHRDVSPHNVLLSWEGAVKVSDFGIAKARAASEATASLLIKGKPAYMSPEQANGQRLDGRSDLFAVGVMLWEMLVGQRLFVGQDTRAILAAVLFRAIPRPRTLRPDVPRDLERVTMKLLDRDLPARYPTAEAALAELFQCADAPRAGREALMAVLAERFPDKAPIRHSAARARSHGVAPTPPAGVLSPPGRPTLTQAPAAAMALRPGAPPVARSAGRPGLGTVMAAPTATLDVSPRRWLRLSLVAIALVIASGVISFTVVSMLRRPPAASARGGGSSMAPPRGAAPGSAVAPEPRSQRAPGPAATPAPPARDAIAVQSEPADRDPRRGGIHIVALPIRAVAIDGTSYGDTPLTIALDPGKHRVRLQNVEDNNVEVVPVVIVEHQTITLDRMPQ